MAPDSPALLELRNITKAFGAFRALEDVDFSLAAGEIHALLGENGAGKSTLVKVMTGALQPSSGTLCLVGEPVRPRSPLEAQRMGISAVYQEVNLLPNLSVGENLFLGRVPRGRFGIDWKELRRMAESALAELGISIDVRAPLSTYSVAIQQMVAITRAVSSDARVLVLDEPTSSLDDSEVTSLFRTLRELRSRGLGIVFITHFLDQVDEVADRITVLRNGRLVGTFGGKELTRVQLVSRMVGKELGVEAFRRRRSGDSSEPEAVRVEGLTRAGVGPVDFRIAGKEVVGLAGLLGSGRTEILRMMFGLDKPAAGWVSIGASRNAIRSPREAMQHGFGLVPEERKTEAIFPSLSVEENIWIALQAKLGWVRRISQKEKRAMAEHFRAAFSIATPSLDKPVGQLSGGNQQKAILARWMATKPRVLLLDEPTRGVDIGAREEIERKIRGLSEEGIAVLLVSSEIDELQRCADRLLVLHNGKLVGELPSDADDAQVLHLMSGESLG